MNIYFFFIWRLKKLDDYKFVEVWEKKYLNHMKSIITGLFILYIVLTLTAGTLFGEYGFLTGFLMMGLTGFLLGYYMLVHFLKFLALQNDRYFRIKMGQTNESINYDNVVG